MLLVQLLLWSGCGTPLEEDEKAVLPEEAFANWESYTYARYETDPDGVEQSFAEGEAELLLPREHYGFRPVSRFYRVKFDSFIFYRMNQTADKGIVMGRVEMGKVIHIVAEVWEKADPERRFLAVCPAEKDKAEGDCAYFPETRAGYGRMRPECDGPWSTSDLEYDFDGRYLPVGLIAADKLKEITPVDRETRQEAQEALDSFYPGWQTGEAYLLQSGRDRIPGGNARSEYFRRHEILIITDDEPRYRVRPYSGVMQVKGIQPLYWVCYETDSSDLFYQKRNEQYLAKTDNPYRGIYSGVVTEGELVHVAWQWQDPTLDSAWIDVVYALCPFTCEGAFELATEEVRFEADCTLGDYRQKIWVEKEHVARYYIRDVQALVG